MAEKTSAEVIIGGKVYTLSGYEGEEYLQKVATYINNKLGEFQGMEELRHLSLSLIHISEPTRQAEISYAVFCLKKKKKNKTKKKKKIKIKKKKTERKTHKQKRE